VKHAALADIEAAAYTRTCCQAGEAPGAQAYSPSESKAVADRLARQQCLEKSARTIIEDRIMVANGLLMCQAIRHEMRSQDAG